MGVRVLVGVGVRVAVAVTGLLVGVRVRDGVTVGVRDGVTVAVGVLMSARRSSASSRMSSVIARAGRFTQVPSSRLGPISTARTDGISREKSQAATSAGSDSAICGSRAWAPSTLAWLCLPLFVPCGG